MTVVGHRGAGGEAPENTLGGFCFALGHGVRSFELDVQLSADSVPVVIHDPLLDRTTDLCGDVAHVDAATLARANAAVHWPDWPQTEPVPTLEAVLTLLAANHCAVQIELKCESGTSAEALVERVATILATTGDGLTRVLTSFDSRLLQLARERLPDVPRGLACDHTRRRPLATAQALDCRWLIQHWRLTSRRAIAGARGADIRLSVYTVNDAKLARRLLAAGVDSVITDYPVRMNALLATPPAAQ